MDCPECKNVQCMEAALEIEDESAGAGQYFYRCLVCGCTFSVDDIERYEEEGYDFYTVLATRAGSCDQVNDQDDNYSKIVNGL
jgi:hypothetical protein